MASGPSSLTVSPDHSSKYHRLASEYSKIRAQVTVLKKAVLDEQAINGGLKAEVSEKDQALRKAQLEIDGLVFHNQQLAKRVELLQDELERDNKKRPVKSSKNHDSSLHEANSVLNEELANKIEENATLHTKLAGIYEEHDREMDELRSELARLRSELSTRSQKICAVDDTNEKEFMKLKEDKARLELRLHNHGMELTSSKVEIRRLETALASVTEDLKAKSAILDRVKAEKLPFLDVADAEKNALNVPSHDQKVVRWCRNFLESVLGHCERTAQALSGFFGSYEKRVQLIHSSGATELAMLLNQCALKAKRLESDCQTWREECKKGSNVALWLLPSANATVSTFREIEHRQSVLLPLLTRSVDAESSDDEVAMKSKAFLAAFAKWIGVMSKLFTPEGKIFGHAGGLNKDVLERLHLFSIDLSSASKEMSRCYNEKVTLVKAFNDASEDLATVEESILTALLSLMTHTHKLSDNLQETLSVIRSDEKILHFLSSNPHPEVDPLRQKILSYLDSIPEVEESSVTDARSPSATLLHSHPSSAAAHNDEVEALKKRISQLEQMKEHWRLECHLLQKKHQRDLQKLKILQGEAVGGEEAVSATVNGNRVPEVDQVLREKEVMDYYQARLGLYVIQHLSMDSKCSLLEAEVKVLRERLCILEGERKTLADKVEEDREREAQLREELQTTSWNYEGQLSLMSEHLAQLNDRLTRQTDEIEELKVEVAVSKGKKNKLFP